jgi:hypothetical protein
LLVNGVFKLSDRNETARYELCVERSPDVRVALETLAPSGEQVTTSHHATAEIYYGADQPIVVGYFDGDFRWGADGGNETIKFDNRW